MYMRKNVYEYIHIEIYEYKNILISKRGSIGWGIYILHNCDKISAIALYGYVYDY